MHDFLDVLKFHQRFQLPCSELARPMEPDVLSFRVNFMEEEVSEYHEAYGCGNLVKVVDALLDFVYVAIGTALFIGCPRHGKASIWPSYQTACQSMVNGGILDEPNGHSPSLLPTSAHLYTCHSLQTRTKMFSYAYNAIGDLPNGLELCLALLKQATDEAYKTAALMSVPWESCWRHVQNANMRKRRASSDGKNSKRGSAWDVVKPTGWVGPDALIASELILAGWKRPNEMMIDIVKGTVEMTCPVRSQTN